MKEEKGIQWDLNSPLKRGMERRTVSITFSFSKELISRSSVFLSSTTAATGVWERTNEERRVDVTGREEIEWRDNILRPLSCFSKSDISRKALVIVSTLCSSSTSIFIVSWTPVFPSCSLFSPFEFSLFPFTPPSLTFLPKNIFRRLRASWVMGKTLTTRLMPSSAV